MAGRALARGALDAISEKFSRRCTSHLTRDKSLSQEPLSEGPLGEAVRAWPGDGQVSGSMATLLAPNGQQASCFPCEAGQGPFVFHGSPRESASGAAALLQGHQHIHLRVRARTREACHWQGGKSTEGSAQEYMRGAAAQPPGKTWERASTGWRGTWSAQRQSLRGATAWARSHVIIVRFEEKGKLTNLHLQAHLASAARWRSVVEYLHGQRQAPALLGSEVTESWAAHQHAGAPSFERTAQMPAKTTAGGNALAKRLAYLTVADNEAEKPEELGLGAAQAQTEDARRAMAEKRKEAQKIEQQKLRQQSIQAVAATTREAESLHRALQAIKGMPLEARMTEVMANVSTKAQVLQRGKSVRTVKNLRKGDAQEAMLIIFAYLAHTHDSMELTLKKVQSQTLFEQQGPEYAPVKLKAEYMKQEGNSVSAEMLAKELHLMGCDVIQMRKMGKDGQCAVPATMKQGGGYPHSAKIFSLAYVGDGRHQRDDT